MTDWPGRCWRKQTPRLRLDAVNARTKLESAYGRGSILAALRLSELYRNGTFDRNDTPAHRAEQAIYWQYRAAGAGSDEALKVVQADLARRRKKVTDDGKIGADSCRARNFSETRRVRDGILIGPSIAQQRAYCIARVNDAMMPSMAKIDEDERRVANERSGREITAN